MSESINFEIECLLVSVHARMHIRPSSLRADPHLRDLFVTALLGANNRRVDVSVLSRSDNFCEFSHTRNDESIWRSIDPTMLAQACIKRYPHTRNIRYDFASGSTDGYRTHDIGLAYIPSHSLLNGIFRDRSLNGYMMPHLLYVG